MPLDPSNYENNYKYYLGMYGSCGMSIAITTALTYPLDLIHTRLVSDMTNKNN